MQDDFKSLNGTYVDVVHMMAELDARYKHDLKLLKAFDLEKIAHVFQEFGFKSLIKRLEKNGLGQQNKLF